MRHIRKTAIAAAALLTVGGGALLAAPAAQAVPPFPSIGWQQRNCDFDGNGHDDVLIGAPGATVSGAKGAGYVTVQYSTSGGLSTTKRSVIHQNTSGVPGGAEAADGFGRAVATGDLDNDGYDDAIVGIPGEDLAGKANTGAVTVFWGSPTGLHGSDSIGLQNPDELRAGANFGRAIEAARFFAPDPAEPDSSPQDSIAVAENDQLMFFTASTGAAAMQLKATDQGIQALDAIPLESGFAFRSLSHGNYNEDSWADLAISGVTTGEQPGIGATLVLHGAPNVEEMGDGGVFEGGPGVVSSDFNHDGQDDLAIGDTGVGSALGGSVSVYLGRGDLSGLNPLASQTWTQDSPGVPGAAEAGDQWGAEMSSGDTNGDGRPDLAIGAPGEDIGSVSNAGAVWALRGAIDGLTTTGVRTFNQNTPSIPGGAEASDRFGGQVRLIDADKDGLFGLLAAAPGENTNDGFVWVIQASSSGLVAGGSWTYDGARLGASTADAQFGVAIDE